MTATHLHLLTNHFPIIGLLIGGCICLVVSYIKHPERQQIVQLLAVWVVLVSAGIGHFSAEQGEAALHEQRQASRQTKIRLDQQEVSTVLDDFTQNRLQQHIEAAEAGHFSLPLLVGLSGLWLIGRHRGWLLTGHCVFWWMYTLGVWATWAWHGWVGYLGGHIRHLNL
jgi:hypothetical protein